MIGAATAESKPTVFDRYHPVVPFVFFAAVLVFTMAAMQPVCIAITVAAAWCTNAWLRGWKNALRTTAWQLPLVALIAVINPLFSAMGSTELFRIGHRAVYAESFAYGICMGFMLMAVFLWFSNASRILTSDKVMALFGDASPAIALVLSMTARLVPQFVGRGRDIEAAQRACSVAVPETLGQRVAWKGRVVTVLMGWSMEDSLERADAMRARGWGSAGKRTQYKPYRFRGADAAACTAVGLLAVGNAVLVWIACSQYAFYPVMSPLVLWWGYVPYVLFAFLPLLAEGIDRARWKRREAQITDARKVFDGRG
ncbi:energy-coupling factor transporter transmembrane component T family protein [Raoultibacter phocaeensis]|uniref:energy-coupling factor transporter transmembrane component T family protein n=1 Tax=Raoultibacter phocaeensis TaxID=2479841 RepID=UPI0015D5B8F4|nr:energy-coupling factor transporter transmembrane component T [Raoultibacter phocaeensis]